MLNAKDIKTIQEIVTNSLGEFFEKVLSPYLDAEHKQNQKEHNEIKEQLEEITEHVKDHEKRIRKLEVITNT